MTLVFMCMTLVWYVYDISMVCV